MSLNERINAARREKETHAARTPEWIRRAAERKLPAKELSR